MRLPARPPACLTTAFQTSLGCRSVLLLDYGLRPTVHLLLTAVLGADSATRCAAALVGLYNLLWLFPAYLVSFLVNCIWWGAPGRGCSCRGVPDARVFAVRAASLGAARPAPWTGGTCRCGCPPERQAAHSTHTQQHHQQQQQQQQQQQRQGSDNSKHPLQFAAALPHCVAKQGAL